MSALDKAFADAQRSYVAAKAATASMADELLATTRGGVTMRRGSCGSAAEQLQHFTGWVYSAIRPIAQRIAGQTIHVGVHKTRAKLVRSKAAMLPDGVEEVQTHPLLDALNDPNELMVRWSLLYTLVASMELTGRQLWWVPEMDGRRRIFPIPTSWIQNIIGSTSYAGFEIRAPNSAESETIDAAECAYFAYPSPSDPHGCTVPLMATAAAVDADEQVQLSQSAMFHRGIHPSHAIIVGKYTDAGSGTVGGSLGRPNLTNAQRRQLIDAVLKIYSGAAKHGEPVILDGMIEDIKRLSNTPAEMDWTESSKFLKARIAQTFGTNPVIMGEIEGANRASSLAAEDHFAKFTVNPKIELLSEVLTEYMGPMFAADGERLVVWIEPYEPKDAELDVRRMQLVAQFGGVEVNELRTWAGLPAVDWGNAPVSPPGGVSDALADIIDGKLASIGSRELFGGNKLNGHALKR
jgi:phage portal protein BeeE